MTKGSRELQLNKRDQFFSDPVFKDILAYDDKSLQTKLNALKARNLNSVISTQPNLRGEAAHNLQVYTRQQAAFSCVMASICIPLCMQVTVSNDKFMIQLELPGFWPEDFNLKTKDDVIILEAVHEGRSDDEFTARSALQWSVIMRGEGGRKENYSSYHQTFFGNVLESFSFPSSAVAPKVDAISLSWQV